jgi:hypothetical protein
MKLTQAVLERIGVQGFVALRDRYFSLLRFVFLSVSSLRLDIVNFDLVS